MHLAEGVLSAPVLLGTAALATAGVAHGLHRLREEQLPLAALLGAVFFVASTIHVPVGVGSVHLVLNGLAGLLLGWVVFPVLCVALLLQAALFSFGGFAVLGANLLIMALPGVAAHYLLGRGFGPQTPRVRALAAGALCGVVGIGGAALLASAVLALSGGRMFGELIVLFAAAHLPVLVVDAAIGALTVAALVRLMPQALART
ncbi:cobalamin biosynthesis protein CbiM [Zoogloeaceae bacteirum Par-f-2]|nr:cobalamin biosynthesis protein CbiM [Zoogloeaceae bacteirum Par-f-2]